MKLIYDCVFVTLTQILSVSLCSNLRDASSPHLQTAEAREPVWHIYNIKSQHFTLSFWNHTPASRPIRATMFRQNKRNPLDSRKHFSGTAEQSRQTYPHRLNFYRTPPVAEITLEQFEQWALDRLAGPPPPSLGAQTTSHSPEVQLTPTQSSVKSNPANTATRARMNSLPTWLRRQENTTSF